MSWYLTKLVITSVLVVAVSEIAKRSPLLAAVVASVPLVSVLAMIWLYAETRDVARIALLARDIFWLVFPSLLLFVSLPLLLKQGVNFATSMVASIGLTAAGYVVVVWMLRRFGTPL